MSRIGLRLSLAENHLYSFVTGAACLSALTFLLCSLHLAYKGVFIVLGLAAIAAAVRYRLRRGDSLPPLPTAWRWLFAGPFAAFTLLYVLNAAAPEYSPDGASYHLGIIARYVRAHGFVPITTNIYADLSMGVELLFLPAFQIGRHSAAALVHLSFLAALALGIFTYGRRAGLPTAGAAAALLVYSSPVIGIDGTSAYVDVATACIIFTLFALLQLWMDDAVGDGALVPIGILAGFAFAAKYTACVAVPYALGCVLWKQWRCGRPLLKPVVLVAACAALWIAPWLIKNWVVIGNPVAPLFNQFFPNPYVRISFEKDYAAWLRHYDVADKRQIPLEVTLRGQALVGLLGPGFLLAPLAVLGLGNSAGRRLLLAALVFASTYPANIGTRFLIPAVPFAALGITLALYRLHRWLPAVVLLPAVACWPDFLQRYCAQYAWRLDTIPWRAALRLIPEDEFLKDHLPSYPTTRAIDRFVPLGGKVLALSPIPEAYTSREVLVSYQGGRNLVLRDIYYAGLIPGNAPNGRRRFHFPPERLEAIRLRQTERGEDEEWNIAELRVFLRETEIRLDPRWHVSAQPNPWDTDLALDRSPVTRWKTWQAIEPGMWFEVKFGEPETIDSMLLEFTRDHWKARLKLEGKAPGGNWKLLSAQPEESDALPPEGTRRAAMVKLKEFGITHLTAFDTDYGSADLQAKTAEWGITKLFDYGGLALYRLD